MQKQSLTFYHNDIVETTGKNTKLTFLETSNNLDYSYYEIYYKGNKYGLIAMAFTENTAEIHFEVAEFTPRTFEHMKQVFENIKEYLRDNGIKNIIAPRYDTDRIEDKWSRFVGAFGLNQRTEIRVASMEI